MRAGEPLVRTARSKVREGGALDPHPPCRATWRTCPAASDTAHWAQRTGSPQRPLPSKQQACERRYTQMHLFGLAVAPAACSTASQKVHILVSKQGSSTATSGTPKIFTTSARSAVHARSLSPTVSAMLVGNGPMVTGSCSPCASSEQPPRHTTATATPTLEASHLTTSFRRLSSVIALAGLNVSFTLLNR